MRSKQVLVDLLPGRCAGNSLIDLLSRQLRRQVAIIRLLDDREVTAVNHVRPRAECGLDEEAEELAQLGRSSRNVLILRPVFPNPVTDAASHDLPHHLDAPGPGIHVAMPAGLVALAPHVDLERLQPHPAQCQPLC